MAKVKKTLEGNWERTDGGLLHKSRWGTIYRSRGSTAAYTAGCRFEKKITEIVKDIQE